MKKGRKKGSGEKKESLGKSATVWLEEGDHLVT